MHILLLAGSPAVPSRSTRLLQYVGQQLAALGHRHVWLEVRDLPGQALIRADFRDHQIQAALAQVAAASAVVVATPVYKAAYSGMLKAFLDLLPQCGLSEKLVLPLATGGSQSHMLALDYALRPVLSSLAPRHVLSSIYATEAQLNWSDAQGLLLDSQIMTRVQEGVLQLSRSLLALQAPQTVVADFPDIPFSRIRCSV